MDDIAVYSAIAAIIATLAGASSALVNGFLNAKIQKQSLSIQEKASEQTSVVTSMNTVTQLATTSGQTTVQLYNLLQDCIRSREEQNVLLHKTNQEISNLKLKMSAAIHYLKELLEEHDATYKKLGIDCQFFLVIQKELTEIIQEMEGHNVNI